MLIGVWCPFSEWRVLSCLDSLYKTKPRISWFTINVTLLNKYHDFVRPAFFEIFMKVEKYIDDRILRIMQSKLQVKLKYTTKYLLSYIKHRKDDIECLQSNNSKEKQNKNIVQSYCRIRLIWRTSITKKSQESPIEKFLEFCNGKFDRPIKFTFLWAAKSIFRTEVLAKIWTYSLF